MNVHDALIAARTVICDPSRWTQGQFRKPATGSRCAIGAVATTYGDNWKIAENCPVTKALDAQALILLGMPPTGYTPGYATVCVNDELEPIAPSEWVPNFTAHDYVMLMFDRAIEAAKPAPDA